jgi:hypothetical protein
MVDAIEDWLISFSLHERMRAHACDVLRALPAGVLEDLMGDPGFTLYDYDPGPGRLMHVPLAAPARHRASRCVVLKRTLLSRPQSFIRYIIAHELAHAHLRNAGRFPGEDPELAADTLAADWGFPRP